MKVHYDIIEHLKKAQGATPNSLGFDFEIETVHSILRKLFSNIRQGNEGEERGLRLTNFGFEIMQLHFKFWLFKMPEGFVMKAKNIIYLDRTCQMPWFYNNKGLVLFEPQLAMRLKLAGDLDNLIRVFSS